MSAANDDVDVLCVRDGKMVQINVKDIVVGDVITLETGESVPCDGVLITSDELAVDESALTGEPEDVDKAAVIHCKGIKVMS